MKKGTFHFLGRKNQSLFDTNIKIKDNVMDNVELVLDSSAIPESGTAKVRSRPTVRHYISSSDSLQGFAVPTPTVPVLPPVNGLKTNGADSRDWLSNGSAISVPDLVEGEILVPPPPSMAPPLPPTQFIPPPLDFMGDLDGPDLAAFHPPSMPPPKPPSVVPSLEEEDLAFLKPPPMAPPKPPSTCSSASTSSLSISTPPPGKIPASPNFSPPVPPTERQQKTQKTPPAKPTRLSSILSVDSLPQGPAPPPPVQTLRASTFNPQNTAKLYNIPKTSILCGYEDRETRPKQILLLEDSGSVNSVPLPNGNAPPAALPSKPVRRNSTAIQQETELQELKENLQNNLPSQAPQSQPMSEDKTKTVSTQQEMNKLPQTPREVSPKLQKGPIPQVNSEGNRVKLEESLSHNRKFSPLLDRKLRNLKGSETSGTREGPAASPLALLMAAKERDKHRSSLSRENSTVNNKRSSGSIQPVDSSPNSFVVIPKFTSSSSLTPQGRLQESPKPVVSMEHTPTIQTPAQPRGPVSDGDEMASTNPTLNGMSTAASPTSSNLAVEKQGTERGTSQSESAQDENNGEELSMPLLPPPPEFANSADFDEMMASPPNIPPPDPPVTKAPSPTVSPVSRGPAPAPKPKPPAPPKLPPPDTGAKPNPPRPTTSKVPLTQPLSSLSVSQATLLSILQKKMLEMDHKMAPMREAESSSDDWGAPLSDEETKVPVVPRAAPQNKNYTSSCKTVSLDMRELESKVAQKNQDTPPLKNPTRNEPQSKHQYGMTFTVRPGTRQPITLVSKGESS